MPPSNMPDFRHARSGSLNIPPPNGHHHNSSMPQPSHPARFDGPRSPPNTSHVPCKFFRQGACQAGNACPFSHDLGAASETICKYFAKGNCKFGPKCANIHILPDGRRINYGKNGVIIGPSPITLSSPRSNGALSSSGANNFNPTTSAITNSLYRADNIPQFAQTYGYPGQPEDQPHRLGRQPSLENGIPSIDAAAAAYSHPGSNYGSPRDDDAIRLGMALSPINAKGLSVLDAPLPASFDSNGISNAARFPAGPWPSSVPNQFGLDSASASLATSTKDTRASETLRSLHTSAFGNSDHLVPGAQPPSSPPNANGSDELFMKRTLHSIRYAKPKMLSASLPMGGHVDHDWEAEFAFLEEDYVPQNLQELLTPAEKARRGSLRAADNEATPDSTKYGSPLGASPSLWGPVFPRQKEDDLEGRLPKHSIPSFGHVGSPLRNSSLAGEMGAMSGGFRSPTGMRSSSESLSVLSQQIQRTRISEENGHAGATNIGPRPSGGNGIGLISRDRERVMERHVSSSSLSSTLGRFTTPIDEEDSAFLFSMEEEDEQNAARVRKRGSSGLGTSASWTYPSLAPGKKGTGAGSKGSSAVDPAGGR